MSSLDVKSSFSSGETSWHDIELIPAGAESEDSTFYSAGDQSTISLSDSVRDYVYENGRTYHAYHQGKYALPNDEEECRRLDLFHHVFRLRLEGDLYIAPLQNPKRILDLGTGTGIWAMDMAELFPDAEIVGNDLSPIQPEYTWPNVRFEVDDIELEWTYPDDYFDYIHIRSLMGAIQDWDRLLQQVHRCLAPGGYFEFQDQSGWVHCDDGTMPEDSAYRSWFQLLRQSCEISRRPLDMALHIKQKIENTNFVGVHQRVYKWPIGGWPKDPKLKTIGKWSAAVAIESLSPFAMGILTRNLGWPKTRVEKLVDDCLCELKFGRSDGSGLMHIYSEGYFVYGRKPKPGS